MSFEALGCAEPCSPVEANLFNQEHGDDVMSQDDMMERFGSA